MKHIRKNEKINKFEKQKIRSLKKKKNLIKDLNLFNAN